MSRNLNCVAQTNVERRAQQNKTTDTDLRIVVHDDGDHADVGQIRFDAAHDVLALQPLLTDCGNDRRDATSAASSDAASQSADRGDDVRGNSPRSLTWLLSPFVRNSTVSSGLGGARSGAE